MIVQYQSTMNPKRVLTILNTHLKFNSYSIHSYEFDGSYKLSKLGTFVYLSTVILYIAALCIHYTKQEYFEPYNFLSKLFYNAVYYHLYLGCGAALLIPFSFCGQTRFARDIAGLVHNGFMNRNHQMSHQQIDFNEIFIYYQLYSNVFVFMGLSVYNIIMLDFKYFAWYKLMLYLGLFFPHFYISNILRYFCTNVLLLRCMCARINDETHLVYLLCDRQSSGYLASAERPNDRLAKVQSNSTRKFSAIGVLNEIWNRLINYATGNQNQLKPEIIPVLELIPSRQAQQNILIENLKYFCTFQRLSRKLNGLLQKQLIVLGLQHFLVLFVACHSFLKIHQQWKEFVPPGDITSIRVNFQFYVILLINDFFCLFAVGSMYRNTVRFFLKLLCLGRKFFYY